MEILKKEAGYEELLEIVKKRRSCREFSDKPLPEGSIEKIIEVARWALSGANSQPWTYIVVTDPEIIKKMFQAHINENMDYAFWMEQMRSYDLRHPGFQVDCEDPEEALKIKQSRRLWKDVPAVIAVVGDGRKQWGSLMCTHTSAARTIQVTDSLSTATMLIHLAAASLGLNTQWVTVHIEQPYKEILGVPDPLFIHTLIPVGYPAKPVGGSWREKTSDLIHYNKYDMSRHMSNRQAVERLKTLRKYMKTPYKSMIE